MDEEERQDILRRASTAARSSEALLTRMNSARWAVGEALRALKGLPFTTSSIDLEDPDIRVPVELLSSRSVDGLHFALEYLAELEDLLGAAYLKLARVNELNQEAMRQVNEQ